MCICSNERRQATTSSYAAILVHLRYFEQKLFFKQKQKQKQGRGPTAKSEDDVFRSGGGGRRDLELVDLVNSVEWCLFSVRENSDRIPLKSQCSSIKALESGEG